MIVILNEVKNLASEPTMIVREPRKDSSSSVQKQAVLLRMTIDCAFPGIEELNIEGSANQQFPDA
jgi:hypothetical protein